VCQKKRTQPNRPRPDSVIGDRNSSIAEASDGKSQILFIVTAAHYGHVEEQSSSPCPVIFFLGRCPKISYESEINAAVCTIAGRKGVESGGVV